MTILVCIWIGCVVVFSTGFLISFARTFGHHTFDELLHRMDVMLHWFSATIVTLIVALITLGAVRILLRLL